MLVRHCLVDEEKALRTFHPLAQRNAFRRRDVRSQERSFARARPQSQYSPRPSGLHAVTPSDIFSWPRPDVRFGFQHDNFRANVRLDFRANFVLGIFEQVYPRNFSSHARPLRSAKPRTRSRVRLTSMDGYWCNKYGGTTVRSITQGKVRYALRSFKGQLRRPFRFRV